MSELKIDLEKMKLAYGLYIECSDDMFDELHKADAEKIVDIAVGYKGVKQEFTLDEFLHRLGFEKE